MSTPVFDESFINITLWGNVAVIGVLAVFQYMYIKRQAPAWLADGLLAFVILLLLRGLFSLSDLNEIAAVALSALGMALVIFILACAGRIGPVFLFGASVILASFKVEGTVNRVIAAGSILMALLLVALLMHRQLKLGPRVLGVTVLCSWAMVYVVEYVINKEYADRKNTLQRLMNDVQCGSCWPEHTAFCVLVVVRLLGIYIESTSQDQPGVHVVVHVPPPPPVGPSPPPPIRSYHNTSCSRQHQRTAKPRQLLPPVLLQSDDQDEEANDATEAGGDETDEDEDVMVALEKQ